ncbi:MAG: DEAD/DEAH box helicase [Bacillota bacterium]
MPLSQFHPAVRAWFQERFGAPSPPQAQGWPVISRGENALILAPTGSGKTLAAFLKCLDVLYQEGERPRKGVQVLYISPLKALNNDVYRNLEVPLREIAATAAAMGVALPRLTHAVRTGDTPERERAAMVKHPPDILITTPESLYLLLTSKARAILSDVRYVIIDEIHALSGTKRGVHLSLSLERLEALLPRPPVRIGLSATQRPLEEIARFLGGVGREVRIIDTGSRKQLDLQVEVPLEDMRALPEGSIWPALYPRILELVAQHRSTLVFVNNRGLAERLTDRLNSEAGREIARVHHGSMSREAREVVERELKEGRLPCLVATSSLELGIDIGAVDLVIQVESPKSVSRGLQRVGRAGHVLGAASKGRLIPKFRGDLLETACIVREMLRGEVEETRVPTGALDVLAQQVVAMAAMDEWRVADLLRLIRRSYCYRDLTERQLVTVLEMLAGRYPSEEFRELRPRIVWDRERGVIRAREGVRSVAILSGGTIPDRGYYGVYIDGTNVKLGEMDEEFVYESREGDVFLLGTSTWRIKSIEHDRITVVDALGALPRMPFWKGDGIGRPFELGRKLGAFTREIAARLEDPTLPDWLEAECRLDRRAAENLIQYIKDQVEQTGTVPSDRQLVVELFPDEVGDRRLVILSPFGGRVNAAWGIVLKRRVRQYMGLEAEVTTSDDVIHLRLPGADRPVDLAQLLRVGPDEAMEQLLEEVGNTPLFGAYFRMNAGRALVLPRPRPGVRRPFWLQRLKAADLLQVARRFEEFPVVLETYREVLREVLDMEGLRQLLAAVQADQITIHAVESDAPSPMASQILMAFIAENLYEWDTPRAERRGALLNLNRELLREILGTSALRELLDPRAIALVEGRLQRRAEGWQPRHADETEELLRALGDLSAAELAERGVEPAWLAQLERERRAARVRIAGEERWVHADDRGLYADPGGSAGPIIRRYARTHGPFQPEAVARRYGLEPEAVERCLQLFQAEGVLAAGEYSQGVSGREYCDLEVLQQVHRQTLTLLRREIEPVDGAAYARFLLEWQGVEAALAARPAGRSSGPTQALRRALAQLQGLLLPAELWEREVLPSRVPGYQPVWLDQLCASGELHWAAGPGGKLALYLPEQAPLFAGRLGAPPPEGLTPEQQRVLEACRAAGADFLGGIARACGLPPAATLEVLWELTWLGLLSNDTFAPLRQELRASRAATKRGRSLPGLQGGTGRWWLTARLAATAESTRSSGAESYARLLLDRYGVVTREAVDADGGPHTWGEVLDSLKRMEWKGQVRQGYFIAGLTGAQFARPEAVERLRQARERAEPAMRLLPAADPANPYGSILPWPGEAHPARIASSYLVLEAGHPVLAVESFGRRLTPLAELTGEQLHRALATLPALLRAPAPVRSLRRIEVEQWGDQPVQASPAAPVLAALGFERAPRKLVYYP